MTIERFTKQQFEDVLPTYDGGKKLWESVGMMQGEFCYQIRVADSIFIHIRSSVDNSGYAADTGQDSIRCWLVNGDGKPLGSKVNKWTTRVPGWDKRLLDVLRTLWGWAQEAGYCESCNVPMGVYKSKTKKNPGRVFSKCRECNKWGDWIT